MEFIIFTLIIIILMLFFYIYLLKKDIKRITQQIKEKRTSKTNSLLHKELNEKSIANLIQEINKTLEHINNQEIEMNNKTEELKLMITNVSHDLRTPLTSAVGYLELLQDSNLSDAKKEKYISIISERLNKLSYLVTNFFEFSKIASNNEEIEIQKENLIQILEENIVGFYQNFSKQNREINFIHETNKIEINTNKTLLTRVIDNLIINAYKHSKSDLEIHLSKESKGVKLEFTNELLDNKLDTNAMFDKFYTSDISRANGNTGLGLAIAKEFVQLLNGKIFAEKEHGILKIVVELYF